VSIQLARDGRREVIGATILLASTAAIALWLCRPAFGWPIAALLLTVWAWVLWFFRDPDRVIPRAEGLFVSPADGVVSDITPVGPDSELGCEGLRIGVFMNVFDVHVNRSPCDGVVTELTYNRGKYLDARSPDAWRLNESLLISMNYQAFGRTFGIQVRQVAGLVARRIICHVSQGDRLGRGQRFGMIKFGSRLELLLPAALGAECRVRVGQKVRGGSTVLAARPVEQGDPTA